MARPDPIPNSAVKRSVADGSGFIDSARVGSRHSFIKAETNVSAFFFSSDFSIQIARECDLPP